jgi:hypothetical protein
LNGDWWVRVLVVEKMQVILIHGQNLGEEILQTAQIPLHSHHLEISMMHLRMASNLKDDDHELAVAVIPTHLFS